MGSEAAGEVTEAELRARIHELEQELAAAKRTRDVLIHRVERQPLPRPAETFSIQLTMAALEQTVRAASGQTPGKWDGGPLLFLRFDAEGKVLAERNMPTLRDTNLFTSPLKATFEKLRARAMTGGGYAQFRWIDAGTNVLRDYLCCAAVAPDRTITCLAVRI